MERTLSTEVALKAPILAAAIFFATRAECQYEEAEEETLKLFDPTSFLS